MSEERKKPIIQNPMTNLIQGRHRVTQRYEQSDPEWRRLMAALVDGISESGDVTDPAIVATQPPTSAPPRPVSNNLGEYRPYRKRKKRS